MKINEQKVKMIQEHILMPIYAINLFRQLC